MEDDEIKTLKREFNNEMAMIKSEQKSFKRRVSIIANLVVPGIGFILYGSSYIKGLISLVLFISYNIIYFNKLSPLIGEWSIAILYYIPAVVISVGSTIMVSSLDD